MRPSQPKVPPTRIVRVGTREVETIGLNHGFWSDLHHSAVTVGWPQFFAAAALLFFVFNCVFAALYLLGDKPIANVAPGSFLGHLYFSIETLATVGYGDMHPQTHYGHVVATIEIFTGMSLLAVMTGLIFARFSRPRARLLFAERAVIGQHDGQRSLMLRLANARQNSISGATARLWLVRNEMTREGSPFRRFHELKLSRHENPIFALSWTLIHPVDAHSLLADMTPERAAAVQVQLVLTVNGLDESSAQHLHARKSYPHDAIMWGYRYDDIILVDPETGRITLDYRRFDDVVADAPTAVAVPQAPQ